MKGEDGWVLVGRWQKTSGWKWRRGLFDMLCGDFIVEPHSHILWLTLPHPSEIHESPMAKRRPAESTAVSGAIWWNLYYSTAVGLPHGPLARRFALWIFLPPTLPLGVTPWKVTGKNQDLSSQALSRHRVMEPVVSYSSILLSKGHQPALAPLS